MPDVLPLRLLAPGSALGLALLALSGQLVLADSSTPDAAALQRFVHQDCGSCHGLTLKGGLGPDIRPEALRHYDVEVLQSVILDGIPDTPMPPWRPLISEADAAWIARYLLEGTLP